MAKIKREALIKSPTMLLIYAQQKMGKTLACLGFEHAELWDCQHGADAYNGYITTISSLEDMKRAAIENKKNRDYKAVILDTVFDVVRYLAPAAVVKFKQTLSAKQAEPYINTAWYKEPEKLNVEDAISILKTVDFSKGNEVWAEVFISFMNFLKTCYDKVVLIAHSNLGSAAIEKNQILVKEIDLPKNIREYVLRYSDQIGIGTRTNNKLYLDFTQFGDDAKVKLGGRFSYLDNRKVEISQKTADDTIVTFWHRIFPDLYNMTPADVEREYQEQKQQQLADEAMIA